MQDIAELERRITAALERIDRGVAGVLAPASADQAPTAFLPESDFAKLNEDLDEERMLNAQLNERLRVVNEKHAAEKLALTAEISDLNAQLSDQAGEIASLRETVLQLNNDLDDLRSIAERGVTEPEFINHTLQTEVEALRAAREADAAELAEIVAALTPLVAEAERNA
jgi:chromosome segregation ATPase